MPASKKKDDSDDIFNKKYWDRPAHPLTGDQPDGRLIAQAVGYALSRWERLDQEMATLFIAMSGVGDPVANLAVRRAYGSIESNTGRRNAILNVAEVHFGVHWKSEKVKKSITKLVQAISLASHRRDDIAHGVIWDKISINGQDHGAFLLPPEYNSGRTTAFIEEPSDILSSHPTAKYRYTAAEINRIEAKFKHLASHVEHVMFSVSKHAGKIPLVEAVLAEEVSKNPR